MMTPEMEQSRKVFKELLKMFNQDMKAKGVEEYDCFQMEHWVMREAHEMCRDGKISWEVFARVMDEAICY